MIYSDPTNKQGIVEDIDFLVDSDSVTYPIEQKTRNVNLALDKTVSLILGADGRWQWDDSNNTDLPIGTTDISASQQDYSFDNEYLVITRIQVKDPSGNWTDLTPIDGSDTEKLARTDLQGTTGTPTQYDKLGASIFLYPIPNYSSTGGLRAFFQRRADYFTISDTIKEPGFAKHLHRYLSLSAAWDFAFAKGLSKLNFIKSEMLIMEKNIQAFYSYRPKDERPKLSVLNQNNK